MILADTSVWIDYLRQGEPLLAEQLRQGTIVMHEMVLGELAIGSFKNRQLLLKRWQALPSIQPATSDQVLVLLDTHQLMGRGVGWIDLHLLTAVSLVGDAELWTRDKRLKTIAESLSLTSPLL
ncbi:type II toxin-antitoxin system VapC family toxin [Synechococcus sp. PCC 7336]|uniref:type II toxin-antitoxin system VapC family toxin n=1 Tax=Synechococcus sp. PCC 7336 TaxID=195250 RepID=UPI000346F073|nr:PIN domain-containing protein [Synechococcus sp. PCC 7336]